MNRFTPQMPLMARAEVGSPVWVLGPCQLLTLGCASSASFMGIRVVDLQQAP